MKINSDYLMSDKGLELLNKLFQSSGEGIMFFNKEGQIAALNPRAEQIFGYFEKEIRGQPVEILVPQAHRKNHVKHRDGFIKHPAPRQMGASRDLEGVKKDGSTFPLELSLSYIKHEDELMIVAFITDITIRKENEKVLQKQKLQLEKYTAELEGKVKSRTSELEHMNLGLQSQIQERKLAENALKHSLKELKNAEKEILKSLSKERELGEMKSRFVSMASHEFRTPLTSILSSANLIGRYENDQKAVDRHVKRIKNSIGNLTNILNDFLSLEKLESGSQKLEVQSFDLLDLLEEVKEEMGGMLKKKQQITFENESLELTTDPHILKNVLINLVSNAIKYSPEQSIVKVKVVDSAENVNIAVIDQGIGIPSKDQKRLFERFHRAENAVNIQGTGLGLHIVKKYSELLAASITFESQEGEGSTFGIIIPKNESP